MNIGFIKSVKALILLFIALFASAVLGQKFVNQNIYAQSTNPAVVGQWSAITDLPVKATHTALLPNGKLITWPSIDGRNVWIWDPTTGTTTKAADPGYNIFCAGISMTADGKLFVPGGHVVTPIGLPHASFYDWVTNKWTRVTDMNDARWYPTATSLDNGDILTTSGTISKDVYNKIPQVYNIRTNTWRDLSNAILTVPLYPFMYETSLGKVFMAGNTKNARFLDTSGTGKWSKIYPSIWGYRSAGTSVMYANNKILIVGGGDSPTNTAEVINLDDANPAWTYTGSMSAPRRHTNTTILPTGQVMITGGTYGLEDDETKPVLAPEVWSPGAPTWTKWASSTVYRGYHSTALLLPDGRVFSGGGEKSGTSMEVFSPPYLFKGPRPIIISAPNRVSYGQKFTVNTPDANSITKVTWIRLGSVTHSFNQSQRYNSLSFTKKTNAIEVTATSNAGQTPPGYWMLFILNGKGVPSVAKIIKVGSVSISLPPSLPSLTPTPTPTAGAAPAGVMQEDHQLHEQILKEFKEDPNI